MSHETITLIITGVTAIIGAAWGLYRGVMKRMDRFEANLAKLYTKSALHTDGVTNLRTDLGKIFDELHDLRMGEVQLRTSVFGVDGENGLRGDVKQLKSDVAELRKAIS